MTTQNLPSVRRTHYAGSWYESNPDKLEVELKNYIDKANTDPDEHSHARVSAEKSQPITGDVLAIIVPHAGYAFSGQTAAYAYKSVQNKKCKRVFLLGPSHHVGFPGAALTQASSFATPFGDLEVDMDMIAELQAYPMFSFQPQAHSIEHSLELQLPFIKHCFGDVKIVPIMIGHLNDESEARVLGEVLKGFVGKDDLVAVSSDFTHYGPRYQYTPFLYLEDIPGRIGRMDGEALEHLRKVDLSGFVDFIKQTEDTICGMFPCEVLMAMLPKGAHGTMLKYATSADTAMEDKTNSVSYYSIVYSGAEWPEAPNMVRPAKEIVNLTEEDRKALLGLAKTTIETIVWKKKLKAPEELGLKISDSMKECFGVFVTILKPQPDAKEKDHKELRGCIGSIYPSKPLYKAVVENAVSSCSRDYRFQPIRVDELNKIEIELSILTPPRRVASYTDIVVGRDGVILAKAGRSAVFLPHVAAEWGWGLEEMLTQLALKAGLQGDDWRDGAKFDVFQAEMVH